MKTRLMALAALALCLTIGTANAQLLNPTVDLTALSFDNSGTVQYDPVAQTLTMNATALALVDDSGAHLIVPLGTGTVTLVIPVDNTGALIHGNTTSVDLVVSGPIDLDGDTVPEYDGVLLTARVTGFGYEDTGSSTDKYDATLKVTGGALAGVFPNKIGLSFTSENSNFIGDFTVSINGKAKGAIGSLFGDECVRSPGYWKTHPCNWPVDTLTLGGEEYSKEELLNLLKDQKSYGGGCGSRPNSANDCTIKLARALIAAKLSLLNGADPTDPNSADGSYITNVIEEADTLLATLGIGTNPQDEGVCELVLELKDLLDDYVNQPCEDGSCNTGCGGPTKPQSTHKPKWGGCDKPQYNYGGKCDSNKDFRDYCDKTSSDCYKNYCAPKSYGSSNGWSQSYGGNNGYSRNHGGSSNGYGSSYSQKNYGGSLLCSKLSSFGFRR
ncbi:MAG: hypothetical protein BIFFINMI_02571 [Phycisphaerae bacterium]|nr:hypothetical protein [Phycisphaerae bacterium]